MAEMFLRKAPKPGQPGRAEAEQYLKISGGSSHGCSRLHVSVAAHYSLCVKCSVCVSTNMSELMITWMIDCMDDY